MSRSPYASLFTRLMANIDEPENAQACWVWVGKKDRGWYGRLNVYVPGLARTVTVMAHVATWVCLQAAPVDADEFYLAYQTFTTSGLELDHCCVMPLCINVDHLDPCTPKENIQRRDERRGRARVQAP